MDWSNVLMFSLCWNSFRKLLTWNEKCFCSNSYLFYVTGTAYSLLHVLLIWLQDISYAVHQLLDLRGQALSSRLLQDFPYKLLCVSVALVVYHGRGPGPAWSPAVVFASSQCDLALGVGSQCGLGGLGGRIYGLRRQSKGSIAAAPHYSRREGLLRFSNYL